MRNVLFSHIFILFLQKSIKQVVFINIKQLILKALKDYSKSCL